MELGRVLGYENLGEVIEIGDGADRVQAGDWVCLPFNIGCDYFCKNCECGLTNCCITANPEPGIADAAYDFLDIWPYSSGQAEYLRVPYGAFKHLRLPKDAQEKQLDYVILADILPIGYRVMEMAGVEPGESVIIYRAGLVGAMMKAGTQLIGLDVQKPRCLRRVPIGRTGRRRFSDDCRVH
jgi:threonine dehydrogenase-like Zn-dependent dehydrogenase